jgi:hypothetical protein
MRFWLSTAHRTPAWLERLHQNDLSQPTKSQGNRCIPELVGRQFEPGESLRAASGTIHFVSQTPLTRKEACNALDTLFAWQGFEIVPVGEKSLKCVRITAPAR